MCTKCDDETHVREPGETQTETDVSPLHPLMSRTVTRREVIRKGAAGAIAAAFGSTLMPFSALAQGTASAQQQRIPSIGWASVARDKPLERFEFTRAAPGPKDLLIDILYCGVCHSDIHQATDNLNWGGTWPVVPGHEIIGRVRRAGRQVTRFKEGQIVGVTTYVNSGQCDHKLEQYCNPVWTYGAPIAGGEITQGGYSNNIVVPEAYTVAVPDGMDLRRAAPVLCAGLTTSWQLNNWDIGADSRVAIVGLGGLGHMGLKLAVDRGADVTVFTTSPGKVKDARKLGAKDVVVWPDQSEFAARARSFDFILSTVPYKYSIDSFLTLLKLGGTMANVGLLEAVDVNYAIINLFQVNLTGSIVGSIRDTQNLINYCHRKNILPEVELIPVHKINEAYDRIMNKDIKFRFVVDMSTLT